MPAVVAFGQTGRPRLKGALSAHEKAMLFDLALDAGRVAPYMELARAAPLIEAFARAYVAVRDREDGIV
jgi:hypothetical protein